MVGDVAQRDAPLDVAECGGERVVARARGDRRAEGGRRLEASMPISERAYNTDCVQQTTTTTTTTTQLTTTNN